MIYTDFQCLLPVACYVCFVLLKFSLTPKRQLSGIIMLFSCSFMESFKKVTSHESDLSLIPYHLTKVLRNLYIIFKTLIKNK